ncbi:MAG: hypothetical protein K2X49_19590, partial [Acetobacteraceae bacterium]|nr:hypothetical protein [Acetobacteraceae bacterium]
MPDSVCDLHLAPVSALLFGDGAAPPLWLWLSLEPEEIDRLEAALLDHLRSPLFPPRIGERPVRPGDELGLLEFAAGFAPIAGRFAGGVELLIAATRIVAERGGPRCREGALACIEALQHRQHAEARALGDSAGAPARLRRFVLAARLTADLWLRFVPGAEGGQPIGPRLAEAVGLAHRTAAPPSAASAPAQPPAAGTRPGIPVLGPFEPPNDRAEWGAYRLLAAGVPLRRVPRDAARRL